MGLVRLELTTSPLSGVRSSHLSYRPEPVPALAAPLPGPRTGGADRDRTDGLLSANQALSQLSYSPEEKFSEAGWMLPARTSRANKRKRLHPEQSCETDGIERLLLTFPDES